MKTYNTKEEIDLALAFEQLKQAARKFKQDDRGFARVQIIGDEIHVTKLFPDASTSSESFANSIAGMANARNFIEVSSNDREVELMGVMA